MTNKDARYVFIKGNLPAHDHNNELDLNTLGRALNALRDHCHANQFKWWHNEKGIKLERNKGELMMLITSEISEAFEGERKNKNDEHLPHLKSAPVELVDALIRIFDYAGGMGYDLLQPFVEKTQYNLTRADHSYAERNKPNGKKF